VEAKTHLNGSFGAAHFAASAGATPELLLIGDNTAPGLTVRVFSAYGGAVDLQPISNPPNPWASSSIEYLDEIPAAKLEVYEDHTREILSSNDSPDLPFSYSVNPYRGCFHACAYCYARPTHEYLGLGAGTDFDRKITVKPHAPRLLRAAFEKPSWEGDLIAFSGVTDCYQPLEASYRLTRGCLQVCAEYRNPVGLITKAPLIERDLDLLLELQKVARISVAISIPIWRRTEAHAIEPFVATPQRRMKTIERLAAAGLEVSLMVAPFIPGITDDDLGDLLQAAKDAGARHAGYVFLRLPGAVSVVFGERLRAALPLRAEKVLSRVRQARGGELYDSRFGIRGRGEGPLADAAGLLFAQTCKKVGLHHRERERTMGELNWPTAFRRPPKAGEQMRLL
jgi:DNA repair photolyase